MIEMFENSVNGISHEKRAEELKSEGMAIYSDIENTENKLISLKKNINQCKNSFSENENSIPNHEIYTIMKSRAEEIRKEVYEHRESAKSYIDRIKDFLPKFKK